MHSCCKTLVSQNAFFWRQFRISLIVLCSLLEKDVCLSKKPIWVQLHLLLWMLSVWYSTWLGIYDFPRRFGIQFGDCTTKIWVQQRLCGTHSLKLGLWLFRVRDCDFLLWCQIVHTLSHAFSAQMHRFISICIHWVLIKCMFQRNHVG